MTKAKGTKAWDSRPKREELFWMKVDKRGQGECWNWQGHKCPKGYGLMGWDWKVKKAHRIAAEIAYGENIRMHALHSCDNPSCCNPAHIRWGTNAENMKDRNNRNKVWRTNVAKGGERSRERLQKLPQSSADYCRNLLNAGFTQKQCCEWYMVAPATMSLIARNKRYITK